MATFTKHTHGTFSYIELGTTDPEAAKRFYGELFGWTYDDMPMGPEMPGMTYTMAKLNGKTVGGLYKMGAEMKGVPAHWASYVTVDNVDEVTEKAKSNGAKIHKTPFDVMDVGRMAVLEDPSGAIFMLWQAKKSIGSEVMKENGTLCWNELYTNNIDAAGKFYVNTLGWKTKAMDMGPMGTYTLFSVPGSESNIGGMMNMPPNMKNVPPHWLVYLEVADCDVATSKATSLGGKVVMPPMDIPNVGRFSIVQDPQGAALALYKNAH